MLAVLVEFSQSDPVGVVVAGGLTAIAITRIWRLNRSEESELNADSAAIKVALRRGYTEVDAAQHLLTAIPTVAKIEKRSLNFTELIRCQNLKAIAGLSAVSVRSKE